MRRPQTNDYLRSRSNNRRYFAKQQSTKRPRHNSQEKLQIRPQSRSREEDRTWVYRGEISRRSFFFFSVISTSIKREVKPADRAVAARISYVKLRALVTRS